MKNSSVLLFLVVMIIAVSPVFALSQCDGNYTYAVYSTGLYNGQPLCSGTPVTVTRTNMYSPVAGSGMQYWIRDPSWSVVYSHTNTSDLTVTYPMPYEKTRMVFDLDYNSTHDLCVIQAFEFYKNASNCTYIEPQREVNFTGYPLDGYSPLDVSFTVVNFSYGVKPGTSISWTYGDGQTGSSITAISNHTYSNPGIYSVSMGYTNLSGVNYTISKSNYILTSNASGMIVNLDVKDAISGALIQDSTVGIRNTSTGVWRNTTAPTGLVYFSTTDPGYLYPLTQGQSITLAANKTGYRDASETFAIPYNNYRARLFMMPTNVINATGTGTVVVNTIRNKDGLTISGISVVLDSGQMGITNTAGATTLYNVTAGTRYVTLTDPDKGYQDAKSTFNLSAGETKLVVLQMVRVGEQPVETPGSPTPTPTGTYDPNDPNSPVYGNYTTSQINEQGGAGVLGMLAQLIALWPLVVVGVLFKFMKSAFS